ncbi:unnamed protein product [Protopolystoma xenopodis]|uniref:peptidyl-tRNA hydrolase n=1 Tax=Protopolystoma xenopodis TaxID=117903 RepID=A0A448X0D4_9PLAT|nr:unnamed protein product [Protopolystoma xenopodis]
MSRGKAAAQCCHATLSCYNHALKATPAIVKRWESQGQRKITLKVESEDELFVNFYSFPLRIALSTLATSKHLLNCIIHDAGRTQVPQGTATVLGIGPASTKDIDEVSGHLKLY